MDQTRNLEIPGSTLARRPGTTFDAGSSTASSADFGFPRSALLAASPYAPLPASGARSAGILAPAGLKPEFPCIHPIRPLSRTSLPLAETGWC